MIRLVFLACTLIPVFAQVQDLAKANANFGFRLYNTIANQEDGKDINIFFSPYSISVAMAMLYSGTHGNTLTELAEVLGFSDITDDTVENSFMSLNDIVLDTKDEFILESANKFYGQEDVEFVEQFEDDLSEYYGAEVEDVDFSSDAEGARREINEWVALHTHDTIKELFAAGSISRNTFLVLVNALYFKADWLTQFKPEETMNDEFRLVDGTTVSVPMMHMSNEFNIGRDPGGKFTMLELPYKGDALSMYIILPGPDIDLTMIEAVLHFDLFSQVEMTKQKINLVLPKFKVTQEMTLPAILREMGVRDVFSGRADLTGIVEGGGGAVSDIIHQAYISIDEKGTEASAATGISVTRSRVMNFRVDQPFIFMIRDQSTGSILFLGRVMNPETATKPLALRLMRSVSQPEGGYSVDNEDNNNSADRQASGVIAMIIMAAMFAILGM